MSQILFNLKDLTLEVPILARDVDILRYRTHMSKIEYFINILKNNLLEVNSKVDRIEELSGFEYPQKFFPASHNEPEDGVEGDFWFKII